MDGRHAARRGAQGMGRSPHHAPQGIQVGREQCGRDHARHGTEEDGSPATRARRTADRRTAARLLGHELEAWLICSATLGLRPEEALGLEWSDIDLRGGLVRIRRGVQWVSGHEVVVEPKTDLSARELVLPGSRCFVCG
ncbi:hypothetical protein [Bifidobacterium bifidum]|uniref:hypothetical protein n=1 Tax=Bifidobacterium bifidum TaxID=1681 RepID=UPI0030C7A97E